MNSSRPRHLSIMNNSMLVTKYYHLLTAVVELHSLLIVLEGPERHSYTKALLAKVRSEGKIVISTTTSGVAASIIPGGRTAHSRFKISLSIQEGGVCNFTK